MWLPDPQRRGEVQFVMARSLRYEVRLAIILGLLVAGFLVQFLGLLWIGAAILLAASLLGVVRGFSNVPDLRGKTAEWRGATKEQLERILKISRETRQWDQSLLDVTCASGCALFVLFLATIGGLAALLWTSGSTWIAQALLADAAALLLPHWITGVRRILTNDPLTIKTKQLLSVYDLWEDIRREGETMLPQLQVAVGGEGEMPCDAKLVLKLEALGDAFLGLQVQVVLNRVQGADFPYLYCVLVARPELGMCEKLRPRPPGRIIAEASREGDVDILVVRNQTTKTGGYHTRPRLSRMIFAFALEEARRLAAMVEKGE